MHYFVVFGFFSIMISFWMVHLREGTRRIPKYVYVIGWRIVGSCICCFVL